jgi:23S rRNA pseudouridine2605 synthase
MKRNKNRRENSRKSDRRNSRSERGAKDSKPVKNRHQAPNTPRKKEGQRKDDETMRINKYIAHSGICSRREADEYIAEGRVKVNGEKITEMGVQVSSSDHIEVDGKPIDPEPFVYLMMHKPNDTITTTMDDRGRDTVMDLVEGEIGKRVYPVGRLDRDTTGLLLLTNDGDLAHRLMHPSYQISKVYEVQCNRALNEKDLEKLTAGVELEDGPAKANKVLHFIDRPDTLEMVVHEGRNHLVKRMIQAIGADVTNLKRTGYAGMKMKMIRAGRWRFLKPKEVNRLRQIVRLPEIKFREES